MAKKAGATVTPIRPGVQADKYPFDPRFEQALTAVLIRTPSLYLSIGREIDAKCINDPRAKAIVEAAIGVYTLTKHAPSKPEVVFQALRQRVDDGKISFDEFDAIVEYVWEAEQRGLPLPAEIIGGVTPVFAQRLAGELAIAGTGVIASKNPKHVRKLVERMEQLGQGPTLPELGAGFEEAIDARREFANTVRRPFGVPDLDAVLDGGIPEGIFSLIVAGTNVGKGIALVHKGATTALAGDFVLHATLEDPAELVFSRYAANILGIPETEARRNPDKVDRALLKYYPELGRLRVKYFEPLKTRTKDIEEWVDSEEQAAGKPAKELIIDYADRIAAESKKIDYEGSTYAKFEAIYARIGVYARNEGGLGHKGGPLSTVTASAKKATGGGTRTIKASRDKPVSAEDVADSQHKSRIAWFVLTLDAARDTPEDEWTIMGHVAKDRLGRRGQTVEIIPNLTCARLAQRNGPIVVL